MEYFNNSLQHILAELGRLDLHLRVQVWRARQLQPEQGNLHPYYIPDEEIDALFDLALGNPLWADVPLPEEALITIQASLDRMTADLERLRANTRQQGITLRLDSLAFLFQLSPFDLDAILVCLAPELDLRYTRLFAYLQDDVNRKHPSVDLLLNLLCPQLETKLTAQQHFSSSAPLRHFQLLHFVTNPAYRQPPLLAQTLKLDDRIRRYLLDDDAVDERLLPYAAVIEPAANLADLHLPAAFKERLTALAAQDNQGLFYFQGPYGIGKQATSEALGQALGKRLLALKGARLITAGPDDLASLVRLADREARLQNAILYWPDFDRLLADDRQLQREIVFDLLAGRPGLTILAGEKTWTPGHGESPAPIVRVPFPLPTAEERRRLWSSLLDGQIASLDVDEIGAKFRLSGGQIRDAVTTAQHLARWRNPNEGQLNRTDLYEASRLQSNQKLASLAQKIRPHYVWDDIVLPPDQMAQLREICNQVRYRTQVLETWGFERKLALGKGLNCLFTGPPGTGKTMAADILAGELGLDLYKIDLSTVVSKFIGETEKNLARIFAEAETSNAILFFDEADALFGKRTEVKDAHDRYANLEISYLLQKMDEYEGVVILATNLRQNMDKAFVRRMQFIIDFPFPAAADRRRIWDRIWPEATPRSPDLDSALLAEQLEIAGGTIRNIALAAAYLAAAEGDVIHMTHLIRAAESEYRKIGKWLDAAAFSQFQTKS